ncbi:hypothetical protein [Proteiniphilum sp. X52]|uniref:hypothetical protein n=1 Tax=Proteiniphilum sp. X52 TaxID=2382159 RepID=UPI000F0A89B3|nr:hypothetical protein [Proteiniphilum sp. X52]RNC64877.1 hypothetical protein D7D25_09660 [Proteiniphilum sp. X52]
MKNLIKLLFFSFILIQAYSCSNEEFVPELNTGSFSGSENKALTQKEAEKLFSEVLSKATYEEPTLRAFLKNQALQTKDNDYNVFYPLTKNEIVTGNKTFVEVLQSYAGYKDQLADIEKAAPLLNIFIPDLTLFDESLSIYNLDINDSDIPVFNAGKFYWNGIVVDSITEETINELPMFHTLVVNESPRRKIKNLTTRSAGANLEYDFVDEAYDPQKTNVSQVSTRGRKVEPIYLPEQLSEHVNPRNNWVYTSAFPEGTLSAFNKAGAGNGVLRPTMYFNLNKVEDINSDNVVLDHRVSDVIFRMKIDPKLYSYINKFKEPSFQSPFLQQWVYKSNGGAPSFADILSHLWTEGNFTFKINVVTGDRVQLLILSMRPQDIFSVTIRGEFKHKTWFHRREYKYWIVEGELGSKWYYPHENGTDARLSSWNPFEESYKRTIFVAAAGSNANVKREVQVTSTTVIKNGGSTSSGSKTTFPVTNGSGGESSINITNSWEVQNTVSNTSKVNIDITNKDIDGGNNFVHYFGRSPISYVMSNKVYLETERFGLFDICIIPVNKNIQWN